MTLMVSAPSEATDSIGTLSDSFGGLTCSMVVARGRYGSARIVGCESFEDSSLRVLKGDLSFFLVPAAYPKLREFIMHPILYPVESFIAPIVPLVVAIPKGAPRGQVGTIFLHPATEPLLADVKLEYDSYRFSASNPAACVDALSSDSCATLTNMPAARHFDMDVIQEVRHAVDMPWILFGGNAATLEGLDIGSDADRDCC
jgi:hypothetical protein